MNLTVIPGKPQIDDDAVKLVEDLLKKIKAGDVKSVAYAALTDSGTSFGVSCHDDFIIVLGAVNLLENIIANIINANGEEV